MYIPALKKPTLTMFNFPPESDIQSLFFTSSPCNVQLYISPTPVTLQFRDMLLSLCSSALICVCDGLRIGSSEVGGREREKVVDGREE